ncbi:MAG: CopG-like 1 or ribbon-helix-helix domain, 5 [Deltaproteobacteria bacterium]|nr:CopG-like 1 or ribbon-helix-helix domain, 5 [Deltaproteobacteria bacterium]
MLQHMKRTTLVLEDACIDRVRQIAQREGRQLSDVVNELLADALQRRRSPKRGGFSLPRFPMGRPRVNLGDRNALEALMDS